MKRLDEIKKDIENLTPSKAKNIRKNNEQFPYI